ncbi:MAG: FAD:protein FMN transferase [Firmicutes bacterium]|nr:FAD:protein FMN transferase [Bacillota bacterium]
MKRKYKKLIVFKLVFVILSSPLFLLSGCLFSSDNGTDGDFVELRHTWVGAGVPLSQILVSIQLYVPNSPSLPQRSDFGENETVAWNNALQNALRQQTNIRNMLNRMQALTSDINYTLSANHDHSPLANTDINVLNRSPANKPVEVSDLTIRMLNKSRYAYKKTNGAFNPAIFPVTDIWQFSPRFMRAILFGTYLTPETLRTEAGRANEEFFTSLEHLRITNHTTNATFVKQPPPSEWINRILHQDTVTVNVPTNASTVGGNAGASAGASVSANSSTTTTKNINRLDFLNGLVICEANNTVTKLHDRMQLDLGAIARGYAVDRLVQIANEHGFTSGVIDFSGDIFVLGYNKVANQGWNVNVGNPHRNQGGSIVRINGIQSQSVYTSGTRERGFGYPLDASNRPVPNARWYHHIMDTRTGRPADTGIAGVTVVGDSGVFSDVLSTALIVLGLETDASGNLKIKQLLNHFGYSAIIFHDDGRIIVIGGLDVHPTDDLLQSGNHFEIIHL